MENPVSESIAIKVKPISVSGIQSMEGEATGPERGGNTCPCNRTRRHGGAGCCHGPWPLLRPNNLTPARLFQHPLAPGR